MTPEQLLGCASSFTFAPEGTTRTTPGARHFSVHAVRCGDDIWSVTWSGYCWNGTGWESEPPAAEQDEAYLARCRFGFDEAVRIASALPDMVTINECTWAQWQDQWSALSR